MRKKVSVAVLTSGGDAPGMNAAVRAIVRGGLYFNADIYAVVTILPTEIIEGSMVSIRNAEGSSVFSLEAGKNIQSLFAASPDFSAGIYTVYAGESAVCSFSWDSANKIATSCEAVQ